MDIRPLSSDYAVSPQIEPRDIAAIVEAGFTTVICNRPDSEIPPAIHATAIRRAAEAAGLRFVENPVQPGTLTMQNMSIQADAIKEAEGKVLAYCASGNRSSIVWSFIKAPELGVDQVIAATTAAGYQHEPMRAQFEQAARQAQV